MHILFNSKKFHKFLMSCACRRSKPKNGRKRRKSRPSGLERAGQLDTSTYMGAFLFQKDMLTMPLNQGLAHDSFGGPERHGHQPKGPISRCPEKQTSVIPIPGVMWSINLQRRQNGGPTGSGGRPSGLSRVDRPRKLYLDQAPTEPASRRDQERPSESGGQTATPPGWPA